MTILITRPEPDASDLADLLVSRGFSVLVNPLMTLELCYSNPLPVEDVQGVIVTSRNALRALAQNASLADLCSVPLFAVGEATALAAKELGFHTIYEGPGTARELLPVIREKAETSEGRLLHVAGREKSFDLKKVLETEGFKIDVAVVYAMEPVTQLETRTVDAFASGEVADVILLSPKTAKIFSGLAKKSGLEPFFSDVTFFCLSKNVAQAIEIEGNYRMAVAAEPKLEEVLALLNHDAAHLS